MVRAHLSLLVVLASGLVGCPAVVPDYVPEGRKDAGDGTGDPPTWSFSVALSGEGSGTVASSAGPLACAGGHCMQTLVDGARATLTATPALGSVFAGWTGACAGDGGCVVVADASKGAGAHFRIPGYWSASMEGFARGVAVTAGGDVVVLGGKPAFPGDDGSGPGSAGVFLARFIAPGELAWKAFFPDLQPGSGGGNHLAIGPTGDLFITARFSGTVDVGTGPLVSQGDTDLLVASFSPDGAPRWARRFGGLGPDEAAAISVDGQGNLAVVGPVTSPVRFGSFTVPGPSGDGPASFLVKLSSDGTPLWATGFALSSSAVAMDAAGDVWVAGRQDEGPSPSLELLRYGAQGARLWTRSASFFVAEAGRVPPRVAVDASGTATVGGSFVVPIDFGLGTASPPAGGGCFLSRYGAGGEPLSVQSLRTGVLSTAHGLATDGQGNVLLAGGATPDGPLELGGSDLSGRLGTERAFFARFSSQGEHLDSHGFGTSSAADVTRAQLVSANASGVTAVAGFSSSPTDFGDATRAQGLFLLCFPGLR